MKMNCLKKIKDGNFLANKRVLLYLGTLMLMLSFSLGFFLVAHEFVKKLVRLPHCMFVKAKKVFHGVTYAVAIIGLVFVLFSFYKDVTD